MPMSFIMSKNVEHSCNNNNKKNNKNNNNNNNNNDDDDDDNDNDNNNKIKRIHRATRVTSLIVQTIVIGVLGTILKNAKAWYGRLSLPDIFGSAQLSAILDTARII